MLRQRYKLTVRSKLKEPVMSPKQERGTRQSVEFLTSRIILRKEVTLLFIESRKAKPQNNKVSTCDPTWECFKDQAVFGTPKLDHKEEFYCCIIPFKLTLKQHKLQALVRNRCLISRQACLVPSTTSHTKKAETSGQSEENSSLKECASRVSLLTPMSTSGKNNTRSMSKNARRGKQRFWKLAETWF